MIKMPGKTYAGPLPPLTDEEVKVRDQMRKDVEQLAAEIGERNIQQYANLCAAADFIQKSFEQAGYEVKLQSYDVSGKTCSNIEVEIPGNEKSNEIIIIGAHWWTVLAMRFPA